MTDTPPEAAGARELFVRHARRDGRSVAVLRAVDYGDSCVIEAEVYPAGGRSAEPSRPGNGIHDRSSRGPHGPRL